MSKDDATWLNVAYVAFAIMVCYFSFKALETLGVQTGWSERFEWYTTGTTLASVLLGILGTYLLRRKKERHEYFLSAIAELRKVTWPTWPDTKRMTIIVCIVVGIFAVIVAIFDVLWARALNVLLA